MSKYSTSNSLAFAFSPTLGSSLRESSFFLIILINITSPSYPFVQTNSVLDDWGNKPSDSKNELSLRTFSMTNETDGSGGEEGLVLGIKCSKAFPLLVMMILLLVHFATVSSKEFHCWVAELPLLNEDKIFS
nr:hypothetical protein [Tanacetum cinerariifolium]